MTGFIIYLFAINALGLLLMLVDKKKSQKNRWRIPERTLFLTAVLGGSLGCLMGMYLFRHKTKHMSFTLGMPAILAVQCLILYYLALRFF